MQLTWHILVIVAAIFIGAVLFQRGEQNANMTDAQKKEANMYRNLAYLLWGIAVAMIIYYYYIQNETQRANMNGVRPRGHDVGDPATSREQMRWWQRKLIEQAARPLKRRTVREGPNGRGEIETYPGPLAYEIGQDRERPRPAEGGYVTGTGGEVATYT